MAGPDDGAGHLVGLRHPWWQGARMSRAGEHYPHLFAPLLLGPLTLANRVVFTAHLTNYATDGAPTDQHAAYYAARAAGGAGLVIAEEVSVSAHDRPYEKLAHTADRRVPDAVHAHGVPVLTQLNHNGGQASGMYSGTAVVAPSVVPDPQFREAPCALTTAELGDLVDDYACAAEQAVGQGFDGVEIQASHSSLVRQLLSPATNHRTDRYGERTLFLREVLAAVRDAVGDGVLGVRLAGDELLADGITLDDSVVTVRTIAGLVDHVTTSIGLATASLHAVIPSMHTPHGYAHALTRALKLAADVPVIGVGRFTTPEQAEQALARGVCDLVGVVRGQVADPEFVAKASAGRAADIRTCLSCNQECVGRTGTNRWLGCVQNPRAGRESVPLPPPTPRRRVLVVGGGPAGLQAAATAAQRGHHVTLVEADPVLGGQVRLAATAPGRSQLGELTRTLERECRRLGVTIRLGERLDAAGVRAEGAAVVVLATGSVPERVPWAVDVRDVLAGRAQPTGRVLVVDTLGGHHATSTAELLAGRGCSVTTATPAMVTAQDLAGTLDLPGWHRRAHALGIVQRTDVVVQQVADGLVALLHHPTGTVTHERFDGVVLAAQPAPVDELWRALGGAPDVHRIGDCLSPRKAHAATIEGHRVGLAV